MKTASMRTAYGEALVEIGQENERVVVLDADLSKATKTCLFADKFPKRFFEMGIAEQNMMAVAAGLATCGYVPFTSTLAVFASMRACEQVRTSIALANLNVKVCGSYGGLCTAENGPTHQCISDIGIMRSLPNMTVLAPSDAFSCKAAVRWAVKHQGPLYIRVLRDDEPVIYEREKVLDIEKGYFFTEGKDLGIIANGYMVHRALLARDILKEEGIDASVADIISLKPINEDLIIRIARKTGKILTVEEHNIFGGLGSAVSQVLSENYPVPMKIVGINDFFSGSGKHSDLLKVAGLETEDIVREAKKLIRKG